jgi:demethoxyubiquinone hydroxylase (CLK1/Coq7/Cat5 family)
MASQETSRQQVLAHIGAVRAREVGVLHLFRGMLAAAHDGESRAMAARHLAAAHLRLTRLRHWLPAPGRRRPLQRATNWLVGATIALAGPRAVAAVAAAVQRAADQRYAAQVEQHALHADVAELRAAFVGGCRAEESNSAAFDRSHSRKRPHARGWTVVVGTGPARAAAAIGQA